MREASAREANNEAHRLLVHRRDRRPSGPTIRTKSDVGCAEGKIAQCKRGAWQLGREAVC